MAFKLCDFECSNCKYSFEYLIDWDTVQYKQKEPNPSCIKCGLETIKCFISGNQPEEQKSNRFFLFKIESGSKLPVNDLYQKIRTRQYEALLNVKLKRVDIEFVVNEGDVDVVAAIER